MKWRSVLTGRLSVIKSGQGFFSPLSSFLFPPSRVHFPLSTFYSLRRLFPILTLLALMLALTPVVPAYAAGIVVTGNGDTVANDGICTLREAINAANDDAAGFGCAAGSGADVITFAAPYVITLGSTLPPISPSTQLTITGKGASATIIQANAAPSVATYRLFYVTTSSTLTLQNLTVRNGRCNGSCATFTNTGGAIYNGGSLTINRAAVTGNTAGLGGAIDNTGALAVTATTFSGNHASDGGAILNDAGDNTTITASTFTGNSADTGGAISSGGSLSVTNSTFAANTATFSGGAIGSSGVVSLNGSTFSGNSASSGADLSNFGTAMMYNSILANSKAGADCTSSSALSANVNNLVEDGSCSPALSGDPKLGPFGNNGGYTKTFPLQAGSPAIDAGNVLTCSSTDQRGYPRPQDGNLNGTAVCDIGAVEKLRWMVFRSAAAQDGWVLESSENSGAGGTLDDSAATFRLGDESGNRQYRGVLSFNTAGLPENALVPRILLKIQRQGLITGSNPFTSHGGLLADIRKGPLGGSAALQLADFSAKASLNAAGVFSKKPLAGNWYQVILKPGASPYVNTAGLTQFRLRFQTDDNNDGGADYMSFASGNFGTPASRPWLYVEYYIP